MTTQLLTGIPGTGKTHHLTERALRYLADGNDPARLLILAPTRTAATRMRDTIAASSDRSLSVAPTRAWAAYAFDLLKRAQTRGLLSGVEGNLKLLSGPEQDVIIGELLANHAEGIAPGPAWPDVLRDALATRGFRHEIRDFFDRMAEYDLTAEDVHALATEHNQPAWHALAQLHTEYRAVRALRAKNAYDPAVLINDACRLLLRAPEFLAEERRRYDLILIDDVQELSPSIYRLLRLIAAEVAPADAAHLTETHPDLFAEGPQVVMTYSDEAVVQGFRGARPDLVTTLQTSFPSMRTRTLTTSYRLPALMMPLVADIRRRLPRYTRFVPLTAEQDRAKNGVQGGAKNSAPATFGRINTTPADEALTWGAADEPLLHLGADGKILDPAHYRTAPAGVYKYALSSSQDEANLIAQMLLEERIYGNHPYRESAIIVRSSADVARIRRVLSSNGIPSRTSAALVPVRDEPAVRPFLDALSLLVYARKRGEKALNPAVHMPAAEGAEGAEAAEHGGYETLSASEAEELMRRSLDDVIAEESRANPLGGAQSAITLLTSRLGGASSMDVRRLRQQLRSIELQSGGHRPSDDLLLGALLHPETLPEEGVGRAVHRIAAVLSAGRKALARPESTSTEVLWALWEASGLEKIWVAQSRGAGPDADAAHRNLDAMIGLFEAADRFDEQMRGAGAEQFLDFIDAQDLPMDTLAARGVRQDAVEILTPALAAGQSWRTVYVCGLQEGTWPNTTVRGSLLSTGDLVDLCDARLRQRAQQQAGEEQVPPARIRSYPERVRDTRHDELRMFAVAATRASTRLVLTAVRNDDEAPGEFFDFVLPTDAVGDSTDVPITRVRRPATLRSLVAELRRTLVEESMNAMRAEDAQQEDTQQNGAPMHNASEEEALTPEASAYRLDAASRTLARLANAQAPGAAPDDWWGLLPLSSTELLFAHRPAGHAELDENYGEEQAENPGRRTITLSPSRLETIHSSPLDWLVSAARAEAQTDLSRSLGTLVHAIAEEYPTGTLEELQTALDERISSLGVPARKEDETDEEYRERVPWESYALYERAKRMILRLSYYYRQHMGDAGWQNLGVEGSFAVRVPVPFDPAGKVGELDALLTGRVDRLEGTAPAEDGTRRYAIVDLKTGKSKPTGSEMETHPQLAAYQIAVEAGAGEQLEERYRAEAAALEAGEPLPDARPQELEYTGYTGRSGGAALVQLGASGVNDESKTRLQVQPALTEHDSWAAELVQHAAELIAGSQVQARHREGGYGCRLPEICPICTRGRQVTQP